MKTLESCLGDVPYSDLILSILPYVVMDSEDDLPDPVIEQAIKESAIRFITKSQVVRRKVIMDTQACVDEYPIELEDCYFPISVRRVTYRTEGYHPMHEEDADNMISLDSYRPGEERHLFWLNDRNWLVLDPAPQCDGEGDLIVYLSAAPTLKSCAMPKEVFDQYGLAIVDGALARLFLMRDRPWYDASQAVFRNQQYEAEIVAARTSGLKGHMTGKHKPNHQSRQFRRGIR